MSQNKLLQCILFLTELNRIVELIGKLLMILGPFLTLDGLILICSQFILSFFLAGIWVSPWRIDVNWCRFAAEYNSHILLNVSALLCWTSFYLSIIALSYAYKLDIKGIYFERGTKILSWRRYIIVMSHNCFILTKCSFHWIELNLFVEIIGKRLMMLVIWWYHSHLFSVRFKLFHCNSSAFATNKFELMWVFSIIIIVFFLTLCFLMLN